MEYHVNPYRFYIIFYHLIFVVKYHQSVFLSNIGIIEGVKTKIIELSENFEVKVVEIKYGIDHIHLLISAKLMLDIPNINTIKGYSSRFLRKHYKIFLQDKLWVSHFWSPVILFLPRELYQFIFLSNTLRNNKGEVPLNINKAIKIRIYPNTLERELLNKTFGCCRLLWNQMLAERNEMYQRFKDNSEVLRAHKYKTEKEYKHDFKFMIEVDSKALQSTTRYLLKTFQKFFKGLKMAQKVGYPNFKSKKHKQTYTTYNIKNNIKIDFRKKQIKLPKIKTWFKYRDDREFVEPIRHVTVSKTKSGKYYISILIDEELDITPLEEIHCDAIAAFDMSASEFLVGEGESFSNPRFYRFSELNLKKLHQQVSRKKKGSQNRRKAWLKLVRLYEKIANQKRDWTHKITLKLANTYDAVILEDLNVKSMQQFNSGLAKSVSLDFSWNQFKNILKYKLEWCGKHYQEVDRFFPSSKLCSVCGHTNENLILATREWTCIEYDTQHHRDKNASANIKIEGIHLLEEKGITVIN